MKSNDRVKRFKLRQTAAGCKLVSFYMKAEAVTKLRLLARHKTMGEVVEQAIVGLPVINNC